MFLVLIILILYGTYSIGEIQTISSFSGDSDKL